MNIKNKNINKSFKLILFLTLFLINFNLIGQDKSDTILGVYYVKDPLSRDESIVKIYKIGTEYRGRCIKLKYDFDKNGNRRLDIKNPDPEKRNNFCSDNDIFTGFKYNKDKDQWSGGSIYDPNTGKTYKAIISVKNEKEINLRGYIGLPLFGMSMSWERVDENNLPF